MPPHSAFKVTFLNCEVTCLELPTGLPVSDALLLPRGQFLELASSRQARLMILVLLLLQTSRTDLVLTPVLRLSPLLLDAFRILPESTSVFVCRPSPSPQETTSSMRTSCPSAQHAGGQGLTIK